MKCPICGAENDPANRFCDQCGSKLEPATTGAPVALAATVTAPPAMTTCPNCGASVLPGEAFCDECGAPLSAAPVITGGPVASGDAPTMVSPPSAAAVTATPSAEATVVCPACGHHNVAGDHFCENCGASLAAVAEAAPAVTPPAAAEMTAPPTVDPVDALADDEPQGADQLFGAQPSVPAADESPAVVVPIDEEAVPAVSAPDVAVAPNAPDAVPAADTPEAPIASTQQPDSSAERQQLHDEIARQEQIIAQFEQMQTMFGANVPPAVAQGLSEARAAREQAANALAALPAEAPAVDPAEVARYQDEISRQEQIIAQFEQMQTMFGANVPPAVAQGLSEARASREQAPTALAGLTGASSVASPAPAAAATSASSALPGTAPFATAPAPNLPKLVVESNGAEIPLQLDKAELIIGREDPISGIFPEVDLTAFGGESGGVSRQHAKLVNTGGQWAVVDLNSTNYTRVDGTKLDPNVPAPVRDGSRIQLGRVVVVFHAA